MAFIVTTDAQRAHTFYGDVLGLPLLSDNSFALQFDAGGSLLRIQKLEEHTPRPYTVLGWQVRDIAASVDALVARGVHFERYDGMDQGDRGIWTTPSSAQVA